MGYLEREVSNQQHNINMLRRSAIAHIPLLPITVAYICGIIIGTYISLWWLTIITVIVAAGLTILKQYHSATLLSGLTLGLINAILFIPNDAEPNLLSKTITYQGVVAQVKEGDSSRSAIIAIEAYGADTATLMPCHQFDMAVVIPGFTPSISVADRVTFQAIAFRPTPQYDLPDEIDPADFLLKNHIFIQAIVNSEEIYDISPSNNILDKLLRVRSDITNIIYRSSLSTGTKEFLNTTITGDASDLQDDTRTMFSATGLSHILALSGLHVGLIAMLISYALWPLYYFRLRKWRTFTIIILLWLYAAITGFSPSVTRAVIMATTLLIGKAFERRTSSLNSLCLAALIILIFSPAAIYSISFQLSFIAVLSILLFSNDFNCVSQRHRFAHSVVSYIMISITAMLGTGLLATYYFHIFPLYFLIANVAVCLLLPFIIGGGIILILLELAGVDLLLLCHTLDGIYNCITIISQWIATLPGAKIDGIYISIWCILPYVCCLGLLKLFLVKKRAPYIVACAICFGCFIVILALPNKPHTPNTLYLTRDTYHTDLIVYDKTPILKIHTTRPQSPLSITSRCKFRYRDFMARRDIDSLAIITPINHRNETVDFAQKRIAILCQPEITDTTKVDYAVICRGYIKNISDVVTTYAPDTILLSYDLHPKRAARYITECRQRNIPYIWLRERAWSISESN